MQWWQSLVQRIPEIEISFITLYFLLIFKLMNWLKNGSFFQLITFIKTSSRKHIIQRCFHFYFKFCSQTNPNSQVETYQYLHFQIIFPFNFKFLKSYLTVEQSMVEVCSLGWCHSSRKQKSCGVTLGDIAREAFKEVPSGALVEVRLRMLHDSEDDCLRWWEKQCGKPGQYHHQSVENNS